jgi:hypothetical protein
MTRAASPGSPKNPEIEDVIKLMGTCIPIVVPNAFKKNKNNAPIIIFTKLWPMKRIGFTGAPIVNNININPPKMEITIIGSNFLSLPFHSCPILYTMT